MPRVALHRSALCGVILLASSWAGAVPYINQSLRFAVTPPPGWEIRPGADAVVVFAEPGPAVSSMPARTETNEEFLARVRRELNGVEQASPFRASITIFARFQPGIQLRQHVNSTRARLGKSRTHKILGETTTRLGGLEAIDRLARVAIAGRPVMQTREIFCVRENRLFVITLSALPGDFKRYSDEFDKVLASFVWR